MTASLITNTKMDGTVLRHPGVFAVDLVALLAVLVHPFSLYVVLVLYWGDLIGGTVRQFCQLVVAAPRVEYSPTEPPAIALNGDTGPFRFFTPKLGTLQPVAWLPPIAVSNLKLGVLGCLAASLTALGVVLTSTFLDPPFVIALWPTIGILAAGGLAISVKQGLLFRQFVNSNRPPAKTLLRLSLICWIGTFLLALPVVAVDTVYGGANFDPSLGFSAIAAVLIMGRVAYELHQDTSPSRMDSFQLSEPTKQPIERFSTNRRAVRIGGAIDGVVPRLAPDRFPIWARFASVFFVVSMAFVAGVILDQSVAASIAVGGALAVVLVSSFVLTGIVHFELAFGSMEYRLYDDELVAYDAQLNAIQWQVPLNSIQTVSVERGLWSGPPGTDAATVMLNRTDLTVEQSPYRFYRQTLMCVETPEHTADRLRQATTQRERLEPTTL